MKIFTYLNAIYSVWLLEADLVKNPSLSLLLAQKTFAEIFFFLIEYRSLSNTTFCNEGVMFLNLEVVRDSYSVHILEANVFLSALNSIMTLLEKGN